MSGVVTQQLSPWYDSAESSGAYSTAGGPDSLQVAASEQHKSRAW